MSGDTSLFRQCHQKFITVLGQVRNSYEEIAHRLVQEIDLDKEREKSLTGLRADYGEEIEKVS